MLVDTDARVQAAAAPAPTGRGQSPARLRAFNLQPLLRSLPRGDVLSADVWVRWHRNIVVLLWLHALGLAVFAAATGQSLVHSIFEGGVIAACAVLASASFLGRRARSAVASTGLVMASAVLVHLSGGYIEAHFHFFVMVGLLALYYDWPPFLAAITFVVIHHGVIGVLEPMSVYNHPSAWGSPWIWAAIHGTFVLAASGASLIAWRMNEDVQGQLRASNAELGRQARVLEDKNSELDSFVYSVSHDLKAPLVTIQGMAGALLEDYAPRLDERGVRYLNRLQGNVQHLERIITDLLTLSRVGREAGLDEEAVSIMDLVDDVITEMAGPIQASGAKIIVRDVAVLWGVRTHIQRVVGNLVTNAIKYVGEGTLPVIEIGAATRGDMVECSVKDNGIGIDAAYHGKIFEMFHRLKEVTVEGTGVGLPIVKKLVEAAGGRVWVTSAKGEGSTFFFTWPRQPRPPA